MAERLGQVASVAAATRHSRLRAGRPDQPVRFDSGLALLTWSSCLSAVAAWHASEMASAGRIYHGGGVNRDLARGRGSSRSGKNVRAASSGIDGRLIFGAFMNSPPHRANITGACRYIGTAWALSARVTGYISVEFAN